MVHAVLPALIPDIRKVYDIYFAAFKGERMSQLMLQVLVPEGQIDSDEFRAAHAAGTLSYWHTCDTQYTFTCFDMETGDISGMGLGDLFIRPRSDEERKNHGVPWLTGEKRERAEKVLNPLWEMRERLFGGQPYIHIHVIGVDPKHQRKGAGVAMAQRLVHKAEVLGTDEDIVVPLMVRMPLVAKGMSF
ncbi:putative GNAT family acetyltransferase [Lasiosphaeria ovina]|uniref:GNAT family acetyltransferase n=1 Tax=Lasiosphaeria ovina TaxID=92902 RepID=A0AAE0KIR2_9PEZI|nr:putative GNAT family acetyltransferase [Lasiosphaeria ovina]